MSMNAKKLSCVLMGDETLLVQCAITLRERGHHIAAVVTGSKSVADWAASEGLAIVTPDESAAGWLSRETFDWFFSIANLRIVPNAIWQRARSGAVNFHDGPLPRYAGLNAPSWALLAGEAEYAVTWHLFADRVDAGDILVQTPVAIEPEDTALTLNTKCFEAGMTGFGALLDQLEQGTLHRRVQDAAERTYFAKHRRPPAAATIDASGRATDADRLLRALTFGGGYANPLALAKIATRNGTFNVTEARIEFAASTVPPGTVAHAAPSACRIALDGGVLVINALTDASGARVDPVRVMAAGDVLPRLEPHAIDALAALYKSIAADEDFFARRLTNFKDIVLPGSRPPEGASEPASIDVDGPVAGRTAVAALAGFLRCTSGQDPVHVAWCNDALAAVVHKWQGYVAPAVPFMLEVPADLHIAALAVAADEEIALLETKTGYAADLVSRRSSIDGHSPSVGIRFTNDPTLAELIKGTAVTFAVPATSGQIRIFYDTRRLDAVDARGLARRLAVYLNAFTKTPTARVSELPLMTPEEANALIVDANRTERDYDRDELVHDLFARQVARTPEAIAVACDGEEVTYRDLDARAERVARALRAAGTGPDVLVGLYMRRSTDLVVGALAILKAGGAYVPLDPTYPSDRIALMIADSGCPIILTSDDLEADVPDRKPHILTIEAAAKTGATAAATSSTQRADTLAYVIYTSGSTGRPKGVMVEHRNVMNFFAGMDDRIAVSTESQPVWLAVTSLSFDISVLELLWTLTRGFKVVVHTNSPTTAVSRFRPARTRATGAMDFSLFYWGNDDAAGSQKYRLLLDGARFADTHGFRAVWTPERHFHAFGGPYPNPSVTGAAVAAVTRNLDIRAGSCVLPLHHVARVAEEWAVVDNLCDGRAGLAVAAGWMPEDFLLKPDNAPPHNKAAMFRDLDILRRLWRGEPVAFAAPGGKMVDVTTQPRPVQRELPVWVTTAGNPDTYREAARHGANVLTHLLGQSIAEVADKIRIYRETLVECGRNPADYKVTLMLHTLVGHDRDEVRDLARGPMKAYLRSAAALIKQYAWAFPAFKKPVGVSQPNDVDLQTLSDEELDAIIEFAFLRYFDDSGLFGTVDDALARVEQVKAIGVDEIACLIDFGVPTRTALAALEPLAEVVAAVNSDGSDHREHDGSIAGLIRRHGVTHLQCTPSMAAMILSNDDDRGALSAVRHLFIGGEALQGVLLRDIAAATSATVENMYGPTETTIWSATGPAKPTDGTVPLGTPIANTQLYVLDDQLRPRPIGMPGELFIGGDGVTRGYLHREDLTRERFLSNPFVPGGRMYRTGDLARRSADGQLQFLGRVDFQVKVRGYRIELGEIEACLGKHAGVTEAVVVAREDKPGDVRIVAYLRYGATPVPEDDLRAHVRASLPDYMTPAHFVTMERFPLTPNAKVDRNALPKPGAAQPVKAEPVAFVAPTDEVEIRISEAFKRALGLERIGALDNFFALGGHSLLAVQVHRDLKKSVASNLSITDIYRFPTVGGLAAHILDRGQSAKQLDRVADRAAARRNAMAARRVVTRP